MTYKFLITTLGCKVNQCESDAVSQSLKDAGWAAVKSGENADICILNTCTVTHKASMQSRQALRQIIRENSKAKIIVTGCYAQTEPEELEKIQGLHYIIQNSDKHKIPEIALSLLKQNDPKPVTIGHDIKKQNKFCRTSGLAIGKRTRPFLKIQDGCNAFCTYCIVPYARGRSRSMEINDVLDNLRKLKKAGYKEVVLSGIHIGYYGQDLSPKTSLSNLLQKISSQALIDRVRISSIEPCELTDDIIKVVAESKHFCKHFHVPLQSGDDNILKKMHRPYNSSFFKDLIHKIHSHIPDAAIGVDTLIGFPGESDAEFENTYQLIKNLPVSYLHVFPFSPRKGTAAYDFPNQVKPEIIKARCKKMRELGNLKKKEFYEKFIGKTIEVLVETTRDKKTNLLNAISSNYLRVKLDRDDSLKNSIINMKFG